MWCHMRRNQISSFGRNGRVHLNRSVGRHFSRLLRSQGVRISGSNAGYTVFRGSVKSTGYPLHSPVSPSLPPPLHHHVQSHFNCTLQHPVQRRPQQRRRCLMQDQAISVCPCACAMCPSCPRSCHDWVSQLRAEWIIIWLKASNGVLNHLIFS